MLSAFGYFGKAASKTDHTIAEYNCAWVDWMMERTLWGQWQLCQRTEAISRRVCDLPVPHMPRCDSTHSDVSTRTNAGRTVGLTKLSFLALIFIVFSSYFICCDFFHVSCYLLMFMLYMFFFVFPKKNKYKNMNGKNSATIVVDIIPRCIWIYIFFLSFFWIFLRENTTYYWFDFRIYVFFVCETFFFPSHTGVSSATVCICSLIWSADGIEEAVNWESNCEYRPPKPIALGDSMSFEEKNLI